MKNRKEIIVMLVLWLLAFGIIYALYALQAIPTKVIYQLF